MEDYLSSVRECKLCHHPKKNDEFVTCKSTAWEYNVCKQCRNECDRNRFKTNPKSMITQLLRWARKRSKSKKLEYALDRQWMEEKLKSGKCCKTGILFQFTQSFGRSPFSPSIDKIDPKKGYTKDNCQIVCSMYNFAKQRWTDKDVLFFAQNFIENNSNK